MDPLSDVLSLLKPRTYMFRGFDAGGLWSLRFPPLEGIRCYSVQSGTCWLIVDGDLEPVLLAAGDCVLLTSRQSFCLASDTTLSPHGAVAAVSGAGQGGVVTINAGGEVTGVGGYFAFEGRHAAVLLAQLPSVVHLRKESERATLRWSMETLLRELSDPQPGGSLVAQQLGQMMLVLLLRLHLSQGASGGVGWLFALSDKQMLAAISAMHAAPAHRWSLQSLADRAYMSRSAFALKFRQTVGEPPMEYLIRWRMMLAGDKLVNTDDSVATIAQSLGYESESAFGAAFRRVMGCSPRAYARPQPDSAADGEFMDAATRSHAEAD